MKVIALKGLGNTGKTTTIKLLCDLYLNSPSSVFSSCSFTRLPGDSKSDYKRIYSLSTATKTYKVGVCSEGDTAKSLKDTFNSFKNCDIAIVACRTKGGSFEIVKTSSSDVIWAGKSQDRTSSANRIDQLNKIDAKKLLNILSLCL